MPINYESVRPFGTAQSSTKPTQASEGGTIQFRTDLYGGLHTQNTLPGRHALALEGSLFGLRHTTFDAATNLAGHAAPVLADIDDTLTKPLIFLRNIDATSSKKRLHLLWLELYVVTAGANGTNKLFAMEVDSGTSRYSSGGSALTVVNPNMQSSESLSSVLYAMGGAVVATAETSACRKLDRGELRPSIEVAGDRTMFVFGADAPPAVPAAAAAAVRSDVVRCLPVILGPTDSFLLGIAAASQSVAGVYHVRGELAYR